MIQIKFSRNFRVDPKKYRDGVYLIFLRFKDRGLKFLKKYPPQRNPDTNYERGFGVRPNQRVSEDLGARWAGEIHRGNGEIRIDFGNNASYAPFVQSLQYQADIHKDWWQTDEQMIDIYLPMLESDFIKFLPNMIIVDN